MDHFYVALPGWDTILHTINGFLAAAVGFSMVDLLNRHSKRMQLSPLYVAMVAFCFSMTIGVMWEFIECTGDLFFGQDMQKDFIVSSFNSVTLDPTHSQKVIHVRDITQTVIYTASGETFTIDGGYLDIGILDTMKDLFVNFIGAICFSVFGYFYVKNRGEMQSRAANRLRWNARRLPRSGICGAENIGTTPANPASKTDALFPVRPGAGSVR